MERTAEKKISACVFSGKRAKRITKTTTIKVGTTKTAITKIWKEVKSKYKSKIEIGWEIRGERGELLKNVGKWQEMKEKATGREERCNR